MNSVDIKNAFLPQRKSCLNYLSALLHAERVWEEIFQFLCVQKTDHWEKINITDGRAHKSVSLHELCVNKSFLIHDAVEQHFRAETLFKITGRL